MNLLPNVSQAIRDVQKRVKAAGGELHPTDPLNGAYFIVWLTEEGLLSDATVSPTVIENVLYAKINQHYKQMTWSVPPPKLKRDIRQTANITTTEKSVDRVALGKEVEAKGAYGKLQKDSEHQINVLIDGFNPAAKRGGINYRAKEDVQKQLRSHLAQEKARGVDLSQVLPKIREFIEDTYKKIEREIERL